MPIGWVSGYVAGECGKSGESGVDIERHSWNERVLNRK